MRRRARGKPGLASKQLKPATKFKFPVKKLGLRPSTDIQPTWYMVIQKPRKASMLPWSLSETPSFR